ncbi:AAA family ATPase [Bartonella sp. HY038]|uniref:AAA family ATPase n=1 Tax=Bartonella sp. HY038 TaxID=2759660 RepID=UPI0015FAEFB3|nr:AAA family ATPase [Bartonella sp. HY038]
MKITKIEASNFRLLKKFSLSLEKELSVIIGKNNCGKTSLLLLLDKFLNNPSANSFCFDDFSIDCAKNFKEKILNDVKAVSPPTGDQPDLPKISLRLFIEYEDSDDLSNIGKGLIMSLDPNNKTILLSFEYYISPEKYINLIESLKTYQEALNKVKIDNSEDGKILEENNKKIFKFLKDNFEYYISPEKYINLIESLKTYQKALNKVKIDNSEDGKTLEENNKKILKFLKDNQAKFFKISKKSLAYADGEIDETHFTDLDSPKISLAPIISFKYIGAKRNVDNKDSDRNLSLLSAKIYNALADQDNHGDHVTQLQAQLSEMDVELGETYDTVFNPLLENIKKFGGIKEDDSSIKIASSLNDRDLLSKNTVVTYVAGTDHSLPEYYNGLGYMNLISMILDVAHHLQAFKTANKNKPADLNLFFIEEPEAHTHPQMQAVFIKNIKTLLKKEVNNSYNLQTILSTHSPHIVAESDFDDIKYLKRNDHFITCKNLKDLAKYYKKDEDSYRFLKQYLTLHRADLFFADKAIFIEGDTERILLPAMMKKIDATLSEGALALLSQNISIIDIGGSHFHLFDKFINFIGIRTLIITDLDTVLKKAGESRPKACPVKETDAAIGNPTLKSFFKIGLYSELGSNTVFKAVEKKVKKITELNWKTDAKGIVKCSFQTEESGYCGRSFEDAFIHINRSFIQNAVIKDRFTQNFRVSELDEIRNNNDFDAYTVTSDIKKKAAFAIDILLHSAASCPDNSDW